MWALEDRVQQLKRTVSENDGKNAAGSEFVAEVEDLLSAFYDDIGELKSIKLESLFDLFLIKTLYVNRGSTDARVLQYLSGMMASFLYTRDLFPLVQDHKRYGYMLSDILEEMQNLTRFPNLFEAYRKLGDYSLFLTGIFPASFRRRKWNRWRREYQASPGIDVNYHVTSGKSYYRWASEHDLAEATEQRRMLGKLSTYFDVYREAMSEASERYILGFDMNIIADKMLDNFNKYRRTGDQAFLESARKYAAILQVDRGNFPSLWQIRRRPRATILEPPPDVG